MKVKELIKILQECDPEADVFSHVDYPQKVHPFGANHYKERVMHCPTEVRRVIPYHIDLQEAVQSVRDFNGEDYSAPYARFYIRRPFDFWKGEQRVVTGVIL